MSSLWYFAYGSNMQSQTFRGRRGVEPLRACAARVAGWRVVFDKPPLLPTGESFASLVADPAAVALGVAYEVSGEDFEHIKLTEGVLIGNYDVVAVEAEALDGAAPSLSAWSLSSEKRDAGYLPSTRYMGLIIEGALEHGLPDDYVEYLRAVPTCVPSLAAQLTRPLVDSFLKRSR